MDTMLENVLEGDQFGGVLNVPDRGILLVQLVHNLVVFWMIGSEHQKRVVTQLTKILKSLGTSRLLG